MDMAPEHLKACFPAGGAQLSGTDAALAGPGAYLVLINLNAALEINLKNLAHILQPGWLVYAGSARGPGGMAARVKRHMRATKKVHWHIDKITARNQPVTAICYSGYTECDLVRAMLDQRVFEIPIPGFGSTDCRVCESHLLQWKPG